MQACELFCRLRRYGSPRLSRTTQAHLQFSLELGHTFFMGFLELFLAVPKVDCQHHIKKPKVYAADELEPPEPSRKYRHRERYGDYEVDVYVGRRDAVGMLKRPLEHRHAEERLGRVSVRTRRPE